MDSSRRKSRRSDASKKKHHQSSRGSSPSAASSVSFTAPTYSVAEDSDGELINKRLNVAWPALVPTRKSELRKAGKLKYQRALGSDYASSHASSDSDAEARQFASSPYEMISIADLDAAAAKKEARRSSRASRGKKSRARRSSSDGSTLDDDKHSPQYVSLSSRSSQEDAQYENHTPADSDESSMAVDSIVFNTQEELERYQRVLRRQHKLQLQQERAAAGSCSRSINTDTTASGATSREGDRYEKERDDTARHYIGVKSQRAVDKRLKPGEFFMYYDKPAGADIPVTIELKIGYMSSTGKIYHYPIQRFESAGERFYAVMQSDMDVKMFPSIASLVQHYHTFSHVDPSSGRLETFGAC
ncbi:hypothetical protein PFISCL1PPCAC_28698 [Pristionchus fissidentatus]|uniref:SH2 domain-containing protein n=1 Tax=Pristionchus fissidentatus TaxID=1538716 RepID=A0AAV5VCS6_9BILA|nr:hypothetical protein PFISCL1PPCAC_6981 [Pristionchus fissidentatus]GMT37401.1 hypothetical protein PFISCL1PPCAC_28698 [Pristionchus fissidentatus]